MDGIHDLGGMHGFGAIGATPGEPAFHADWERRTFGLVAALRARDAFNTSEFRNAIERIDPAAYLTTGYYEHWAYAVATLAVEKGILPRDVLPPGVRPVARAGGRPEAADAGFAVGERVRVRNLHTPGHTRCPRYVRGRVGVVTRCDPESALPDIEADGERAPAERAYSVRFAAAELWGDEAEPHASVNVDLWQSYLARA